MLEDQAVLASMPDFIRSSGAFMKATPAEEGGKRILYLEASNEEVDHQEEVVLQKALTDSSGYFTRHGNIDISHYSLLGPKLGMANHLEYEIGRPQAVGTTGKKTFVKAELYQGESPMARNATMVWDSLTKQSPPMRWYPSVGGSVLAKSVRTDPKTNERVGVIEKVRWNNIALDRQPVNKTVPEASLLPIGTFAKSLGGWTVAKTLTAGYGTDSAQLAGGAAMREQSLYGTPASYWDFRNKIAEHMRSGVLGKKPGARDIINHATKKLHLSSSDASEWTERFLRDLSSGLTNRSKS